MSINHAAKKLSYIFSLFLILGTKVTAQEALKSTEEEYYDFLSLTGTVVRPTLGYRTLSDSRWLYAEIESYMANEDGTFSLVRMNGKDSAENIWKKNNLGSRLSLWQTENPATNWFAKGINQNLILKIYGPEWYNSYNTAAPYGQNDGALWQGKGYNTSLTAGVRLESYGFELTFKPQVSFSENGEFEYTTPNYSGELYKNKAALFGDYSLGSLDAPQRFGNNSFFSFSLGDSEIRYSWKSLTVGFGKQNIWIGPAQLNPIIHSNNAEGYPHFDFGLRKTNITLCGIDFGTAEFRYWAGKLTESEYFDNNQNNNNNLITAISISYKPPLTTNLVFGFNRSMLSKWSNFSSYTLFTLLVPFMKQTAGYDESDQRASITVDYFIPRGGVDIYLEWGKNDYNSGLDNLIRYPFHTQAITAGLKKITPHNKTYGQILFEITFIESSMDYHFFYDWGGTGNDFYAHHIITQGYTHKGQYIGAGIGAGGNSQYLSYTLFYPKGNASFFIYRINPDLNYSYFLATRDSTSTTPNDEVKSSIRTLFDIGISSVLYITDTLRVNLQFVLSDEHNPCNTNSNITNHITNKEGTYDSEHRLNFVSQLAIKLYL